MEMIWNEDVPSSIAEEAISFAKVLKFFSMSSSFDRRVRSESWILGESIPLELMILLYQRLKEYLKLPYSAGTKHPHIAMTVSRPICRKYVLFPLFLVSENCCVEMSRNMTNQTYYQKEVNIELLQPKDGFTLVLAQFEMKKNRSNRHRLAPEYPHTAHSQAQGDDRL